MVVVPVRNARVIPFQEILVEGKVFIEELQGGFEPAGNMIELVMVEAFAVYTGDPEHSAEVSALCEKNIPLREPEERDLGMERACGVVFLNDAFQLYYGEFSRRRVVRTFLDRTRI